MPRSNVYALRNLSFARKLVISVALVAGFGLFLSAWTLSIVAINWGFSWMTVADWGVRLGMLSSHLRYLLLCFVVIGAGPTGVEVASEVRDLLDKCRRWAATGFGSRTAPSSGAGLRAGAPVSRRHRCLLAPGSSKTARVASR
jgi:hypothetical protein